MPIFIDYSDGMHIIDISNPLEPKEVGYINGFSQSSGILINDNHAYVIDKPDLHVIDILDPSNPIQVGSCSLNCSYFGPWSIDIYDDYAYICAYECSLSVVNISNPSNPVVIDNYYVPHTVYDIIIVDSIAYCVLGVRGLRIIDVSIPSNLVEIGFYDPDGCTYGLFISGEYAYLSCVSDEGLCVINISDPTNPILAGFYNIPSITNYVENGYSYIIYGESVWYGFQIYRYLGLVGVEEQTEFLNPHVNISIDPSIGITNIDISYFLPVGSNVSLKIYNLSGQLVKTLESEYLQPGQYTLTWDLIDNYGIQLSSGVYLYRFETDDYIETDKFVIIK